MTDLLLWGTLRQTAPDYMVGHLKCGQRSVIKKITKSAEAQVSLRLRVERNCGTLNTDPFFLS